MVLVFPLGKSLTCSKRVDAQKRERKALKEVITKKGETSLNWSVQSLARFINRNNYFLELRLVTTAWLYDTIE